MEQCDDHKELHKTITRIENKVDQIQAVVCGGIDANGNSIKGIISRVQSAEFITKFLLSLSIPIIGGIIVMMFTGI